MAPAVPSALLVLAWSTAGCSLCWLHPLCRTMLRTPTASVIDTYGGIYVLIRIICYLFCLELGLFDALLAAYLVYEFTRTMSIACAVGGSLSALAALCFARVFQEQLHSRELLKDALAVVPDIRASTDKVAEEGQLRPVMVDQIGRMSCRRWRAFLTKSIASASSQELETTIDIVYTSDDVPERRLDWIRRAGLQRGSAPVLLYFHGGGWGSMDKLPHTPIIQLLAQQMNLHVLTVNYGLDSHERQFPNQLHDCMRALAWAIDNVATSDSMVFAMGDSAGGQLALLVGLTHAEPRMLPSDLVGRDLRVDGIIDLYAAHDPSDGLEAYKDFGSVMRPNFGMMMSMDDLSSAPPWHETSPTWWVEQASCGNLKVPPPMMVLQGTNDGMNPLMDTQHFIFALRKLRRHAASQLQGGLQWVVPDVYVELPGAVHGFASFGVSLQHYSVADAIAHFLEAILVSAGGNTDRLLIEGSPFFLVRKHNREIALKE